VDEFIIIIDNGDRTCDLFFYNGFDANSFNCTDPFLLYQQTCGFLNAEITLSFENPQGLGAGDYEPNMERWLSNVGFASLQIINNTLTIQVLYPDAIPVSISPLFLSSLQQVSSLVITERDSVVGNPPVLTGLPGLSNLYQLYDGPQGTYLEVSGTGFTDMTSFSGLTCPPVFMALLNNPVLTSFAGLELVSSPVSQPGQALSAVLLGQSLRRVHKRRSGFPAHVQVAVPRVNPELLIRLLEADPNSASPGVVLLADFSGPFASAAALDPIKVMMGCYNNVTSFVQVPVACGVVLSSSSQICTYVYPEQCRYRTPAPRRSVLQSGWKQGNEVKCGVTHGCVRCVLWFLVMEKGVYPHYVQIGE
jgi:hypothetical protein